MPVSCVCRHCSAAFYVAPSRIAQDRGRYCSPACYWQGKTRKPRILCAVCQRPFKPHTTFTRTFCSQACRHSPAAVALRLWRNIRVCSHGPACPYCCFLWTGTVSKYGYGVINIYHPRRATVRAHRMVWSLHHRRDIPPGQVCAHYCHTRHCCNPLHLHVGTMRDNMADSMRDNRTRTGERNNKSRLRAIQIPLIFARYVAGDSSRALATALGVCMSAILRVLHRHTWKHIPIPADMAALTTDRLARRRRGTRAPKET